MPRSRFSDRVGVTKPKTVLQVAGMDEPLRNSLWNFIVDCLTTPLLGARADGWLSVTRLLAGGFFKVEVDRAPLGDYFAANAWLHTYYENASWSEVYNLVEFIVQDLGGAEWFPRTSHELADTVNGILEEERSAYRFIAGQLVAISNPTEVSGIEHALQAASETGLAGTQTHLAAALARLALRPTPTIAIRSRNPSAPSNRPHGKSAAPVP